MKHTEQRLKLILNDSTAHGCGHLVLSFHSPPIIAARPGSAWQPSQVVISQ